MLPLNFRVYSFKWVESPEHGNGGPDWVEVISKEFYLDGLLSYAQNHVEAYISIAGTHLVRHLDSLSIQC